MAVQPIEPTSKRWMGQYQDKKRPSRDINHYKIEEIPAESDSIPLDSPVVATVHLITWVVYWVYMFWRVKLTWEMPVPNRGVGAFLWLNVVVEVMNIVPHFLARTETFLYIPWGRRPAHNSSYYLHGDLVPPVDVFITCCGEELDVIMDTVAGAASQDYPHEKLRIFLLDDAKSSEVETAVHRLNRDRSSTGFQNVIYLARHKQHGVPHHYKAGNIRFGLAESAQENGGADLCASLDADMIPVKDWLRRVVPHMLFDENVAMAMPPQNAGEDILCAWLLGYAGWKVKFVEDEVQFGMVPGSLAAWFKQRARWTDGNILTYRQFGWFLFGKDLQSDRTILQRAICLCHVMKTYMAIPNSVMFLLLPCILYPVQSPGIRQPFPAQRLAHQSHILLLVATLLQKYSFCQMHEYIGIKAAKRQQSNRAWNTPLNAARIIRSWIPGNIVSFDITGTIVSAANERSAKLRKPLLTRLRDPMVPVYIAWMLYSLILLGLRMRFYATPTEHALEPMRLLSPSPGAVTFFFSAVTNLAVPIQYMIWPPTTPERRHLLNKDPDGVYRAPAETDDILLRNESKVSWKDVVEISLIFEAMRTVNRYMPIPDFNTPATAISSTTTISAFSPPPPGEDLMRYGIKRPEPRPVLEYFEGLKQMAITSQYLVVFVPPGEFAESIRAMNLPNVVVLDHYQSVWDIPHLHGKRDEFYGRQVELLHGTYRPNSKPYGEPHSWAGWNIKSFLILEALKLDPFRTTNFAWLDARVPVFKGIKPNGTENAIHWPHPVSVQNAYNAMPVSDRAIVFAIERSLRAPDTPYWPVVLENGTRSDAYMTDIWSVYGGLLMGSKATLSRLSRALLVLVERDIS
ncbi:hypothetical protein FE257_004555 [Aspergillus nanangensis]|uniref:Glycosyltransferase 2-like domain-containing protein n=1 Tax=Aspergillus nanangensis TaxID=2582783 RepID=A0AAD4D008_ASPNN|nr:hypothetical protein FE257_004555 [Aspergillus nanangensis]